MKDIIFKGLEEESRKEGMKGQPAGKTVCTQCGKV